MNKLIGYSLQGGKRKEKAELRSDHLCKRKRKSREVCVAATVRPL